MAIAARDPERATRVARRNGIPVVHESYQALLDDPAVDAVYIPLPAALHGFWTLSAIAAGKHVLCEKPFTANAEEAHEVEAAAEGSGVVVMQAHHTSFHPFAARLRNVVRSGILGELREASAWSHGFIPPGKHIRWNPRLGGGSLMDLSVYPLRLLQGMLGDATVVRAPALRRGDIDRRMTADLDFAGLVAQVDCGMWSSRGIGAGLEVMGFRARMRATWPCHPQLGGRLHIDGPDVRIRERADRKGSYPYQLEAFRDAVASDNPADFLTTAVSAMELVDQIYRSAGMRPRRPLAVSF